MRNPIERRQAPRWSLLAGLAILALMVAVVPATAASGGQSNLAGAREATARFHDLATADAAGYAVQVSDLAGITCIASPTASDGAMGVHYLNPTLVPELFDPAAAAEVDAATPELLVFAPGPDGQLRLAALEYLTIKASWDAQHAGPPTLFGQPFNVTSGTNRYGLPAFYSLHAWIWDPNPTDMFAPYNTQVSCP
jgi:hypothetical protein